MSYTARHRWIVAPSLCLLWIGAGCSGGTPGPLSADELAAVKKADQAYAGAWRNNDSGLVMAALTDDAVLIPAGMSPLIGTEAIRLFWWPADSPPTTITGFVLVQHEVGGSGDIGYVRGSLSLDFEYDGDAYSNRGEYLTILRRQADSTWQISYRMWNDYPQDST